MTPDRRRLFRSGIRIGASVQEDLDQVEHGLTIDAVFERLRVVHVHVAGLDRGPQGRAMVPVGDVDLRAVFDREAGHVHVVVRDRHQQRRDAVGIGLVDVGPGRRENPCRFESAVARGI